MAEPHVEVPSSAAALAVPTDTPGVHRGFSLGQLLRRATSKISDSVNAIWALRGCTSVGLGARVKGRVRIENRGTITIGQRFNLSGRWIPCELMTGAGGRIEIGDGVWVNYGTTISARHRVVIGKNASIGMHCILSDSDFLEGPEDSAGLPVGDIEIGEGAWIAGRVTVRPGVKVGAGEVVIS